MSELPASIVALFHRQTAASLRQNLRTAHQSGDSVMFDGLVRWRLEAFDAERIWEGEDSSLDDMTVTVIATLNALMGGREDEEVQLTIEEQP